MRTLLNCGFSGWGPSLAVVVGMAVGAGCSGVKTGSSNENLSGNNNGGSQDATSAASNSEAGADGEGTPTTDDGDNINVMLGDTDDGITIGLIGRDGGTLTADGSSPSDSDSTSQTTSAASSDDTQSDLSDETAGADTTTAGDPTDDDLPEIIIVLTGDTSNEDETTEVVDTTSIVDTSDAADTPDSGVELPDAAVPDPPDATTLDTGIGEPDARVSFDVSITSAADWVALPAQFSVLVELQTDLQPTYAWQLISAPLGTEAFPALDDPTAAEVTFYPELPGTYEAEVTVTVGSEQLVRRATLNVKAVDVGFVVLAQAQDSSQYTHTPHMVTSDGLSAAFTVGCAYDTNTIDASFYGWQDEVLYGEQTLAASYPQTPADKSRFAYRLRGGDGRGVTQVANATSDCDTNRPPDLPPALDPVFSPDGKRLAYESDSESDFGALNAISIDGSNLLTLGNPLYMSDIAWLDAATAAFSGVGPFEDSAVGSFSDVSEGPYMPLTACDDADAPFGSLSGLAAGSNFVLLQEYDRLWRVPIELDGEQNRIVSCEADEQINTLLASNVTEFALSGDGSMLALVVEYRSEGDYVSLMIGPSDGSDWTAIDLDPTHWHFGLQWIAGSKQLVWTDLWDNYEYEPDTGAFLELPRASLWRINADGTHVRLLAQETSDSSTIRVLTTGSANPRLDTSN